MKNNQIIPVFVALSLLPVVSAFFGKEYSKVEDGTNNYCKESMDISGILKSDLEGDDTFEDFCASAADSQPKDCNGFFMLYTPDPIGKPDMKHCYCGKKGDDCTSKGYDSKYGGIYKINTPTTKDIGDGLKVEFVQAHSVCKVGKYTMDKTRTVEECALLIAGDKECGDYFDYFNAKGFCNCGVATGVTNKWGKVGDNCAEIMGPIDGTMDVYKIVGVKTTKTTTIAPKTTTIAPKTTKKRIASSKGTKAPKTTIAPKTTKKRIASSKGTKAPKTTKTIAKKRIASGYGDPHFKTWGGDSYDFHGGCDLVLLHNPRFGNGQGMNIHIRTKIQTWWSNIESAILQIGENTLQITGGHKSFKVWINGEEKEYKTAKGSMRMGDFALGFCRISPIQSLTRVNIGSHGDAISIETYKHFVRVNIRNEENVSFDGAVGLLGSYPSGAKVGRDRKTIIEDPNEFGQEWMVIPTDTILFPDVDAANLPLACAMPSSEEQKKTGRRRLGGEETITEEQAGLACARVAEEDRDACIFDVLATQDKGIAGSY